MNGVVVAVVVVVVVVATTTKSVRPMSYRRADDEVIE
jgi:hypothetical protein